MRAKVTYFKHTNKKGCCVSGQRLAVVDQTFRLYDRGWVYTRNYKGGQVPYAKADIPALVDGDDKHACIFLSR